MKTVVVTGATSMIGAALIRACLAHQTERIYAVVREGCSKLDRIPEDARVQIVTCSIEHYDELPRMIDAKCDVFYHIAWSLTGEARNRNLYEQAKNVAYTLDAVHAAKTLGCEKFVGAGSQAEYGRLDIEKISELSPVNPVQPYGIAKYASGKMAMEQAKLLDISCLWVRIFSVYGIYDKPTSMVASALVKMLHGEQTHFTPAEQLWDYLFSEDAGEAFYLVGEKATGHKVYCLGSGTARPLHEYIAVMQQCTGTALPSGIGDIAYPPGVLMHLCADTASLQAETGFKPKTDFEQGITRTVQWLKGEKDVL